MQVEREQLARQANDIAAQSRYGSSAPRLSRDSTLRDVEEWLQWCDGNGSHLREKAEAEDIDPYTLDTAWEALETMLRG